MLQARQGVLEGHYKEAKLSFLLTGHNTFLQWHYESLRGDVTPPVHKSPVPSLPHIFSSTLGFNSIYLPFLLSSCPMSASASSCRQKTLTPSKLLQLQEQCKHKKAAQCPGTAGREDAEGQQLPPHLVSTPSISPSHCTPPWLPAQVPQLPTSPAHTAHVCTHVPGALLTAGIEDTFLDFEIVLCKILPRMTCRGAFSQHFHSAQQFGLKASRFGKTKSCTTMLAEQRGKLPSAYSIFLDMVVQLFVSMSTAFPDKV